MAPPPAAQGLIYLPAELHDHAAVVALMTELVLELDPTPSGERIIALLPDDMYTALVSPDICIFIAWDDGRAVGLCRGDILDRDPIFRLREEHRCGYVDQMYVQPTYRDDGVGQALLACCEQWFRSMNLGQVLLHAAPRAVRFYARCGYQPNREMYKDLT